MSVVSLHTAPPSTQSIKIHYHLMQHLLHARSHQYTLLMQQVLHEEEPMPVDHAWLLMLPQLPSSPSSLRVLIWRRLRSAGALGLQQGVWVLPHEPDHERFARELRREIEQQDGSMVLLTAAPLDGAMGGAVIERFRADRDQEYVEFRGRSRDFLAEIEQETARENFTFAELEENEQDLNKLAGWLAKIQARDFFHGHERPAAEQALDACRQTFEHFAHAVYIREGLDPPIDAPSGPKSTRET